MGEQDSAQPCDVVAKLVVFRCVLTLCDLLIVHDMSMSDVGDRGALEAGSA